MAKKSTKAAKATKAPAKTKSNGHAKFSPDAKITLLVPVAQNPKRKGSKEAKRYALYRSGMSVQAALDAGMAPSNLARDVARKCIRICG